MFRLPESGKIALAFALLYGACAAPVYHFDGYTYQIQGLQALENLNPHHLFWIPVQAFLQALSHWTGVCALTWSTALGCLSGGLVLGLVSAWISAQGRDAAVRRILVLAVGFSPQFWFLVFQNEPYMACFFGTLASLMILERGLRLGEFSGKRLTGSALALAFAVHFNRLWCCSRFPRLCGSRCKDG